MLVKFELKKKHLSTLKKEIGKAGVLKKQEKINLLSLIDSAGKDKKNYLFALNKKEAKFLYTKIHEVRKSIQKNMSQAGKQVSKSERSALGAALEMEISSGSSLLHHMELEKQKKRDM